MDKEYRKFMNDAKEAGDTRKLEELSGLVKAEKFQGYEDFLNEIAEIQKGLSDGLDGVSNLHDYQENEINNLEEQGAESSINFEEQMAGIQAEIDQAESEIKEGSEHMKEIFLQRFALYVHQAEDDVEHYISTKVKVDSFRDPAEPWNAIRTLLALVKRGTLSEERFNDMKNDFFEGLSKEYVRVNSKNREVSESQLKEEAIKGYEKVLNIYDEEVDQLLEDAKDML